MRILVYFHFKNKQRFTLGSGIPGSGNLGKTSLSLYFHLTCHPQTISFPKHPNISLIECTSLNEFLRISTALKFNRLASYGWKCWGKSLEILCVKILARAWLKGWMTACFEI